MKKMIPMLVSAAVAMPMVAMADGPTVYGKINAAIVSDDNGSSEDVYVADNASRLGVKGAVDLDGGLKAVYQLEYGTDPSETKGVESFTRRNSFVGVQGGFGTILTGSHDTPLKMAQGKVDLFNDLVGADITNVVNGEIRGNDVVAYLSPDFSGLKVIVAATAPVKNDPVLSEGGYSASVSYGQDNLFVALAMDSEIAGWDQTRVAATYTMGGLQLGALYNQSELSDGSTDSESGMVLSAGYTMDKLTYKLQLAQSDEQSEGEEQIALGVDYKLGDKTKAYVYYSGIEDDANNERTVYGLGLDHSF